jgi:O-antigen ligase
MTFYPLVAVVPWFLSIPSNPVSVSYRMGYLMLSLVLIAYGVIHIKKVKFSFGFYALMVFWVGYIFRLVYDLSIRDIKAYQSDFYLYTFTIGGCFIPALAVGLAMPLIDTKRLIKWYWVFLFLVNTVVSMQLISIFGIGPEMFANRLRITIEGADVFNPIPLSRGGGVLAIMSMFFLLFQRFKLFSKQTVPLVIAFLLGVINLLLGASRGPLASFFIMSAILLSVHAYLVKKNLVYILKALSTVVVSAILSLVYIVPLIIGGKLSVVNRTAKALDANLGEEVRAYQWRAAWEQIKDSPIWGERIVETHLNFYPHNFFIEIVLSTGILGGILFIAIFTDLFRKFWLAVRLNSIVMVLFFLLGLQFLYGLSGLSIPTGWYVWMLIAVCLSCSINQKTNYLEK